jgi:hypothetical protein
MRVRLIRKLAECIDGVDLSRRRTGDILDLSPYEARLLISERWAVPVPGPAETRHATVAFTRAIAADSPARRTADQLRRVREQMESHQFERLEARRIEDRIREEIHDARARVIAADTDRDLLRDDDRRAGPPPAGNS